MITRVALLGAAWLLVLGVGAARAEPACGDGVCDPSPAASAPESECLSCNLDCVCGRGQPTHPCFPLGYPPWWKPCGSCTDGAPDGICDASEDCGSCPLDCTCEGCVGGAPDGTCGDTEGCALCPWDCPCPGCLDDAPNGVCDPGEDCAGCPADCCLEGCAGGAADGVCADEESCLACPEDCCPCGAEPCPCCGEPPCTPCPGPFDVCTPEGCVCQPACGDAQCGPDGCGGSCGACPDGTVCAGGICACVPDCDGQVCLDPDGCGGTCSGCAGPQEVCTPTGCVCEPACEGRVCGDDGCDGTCGACREGSDCVDGACSCDPDCAGAAACDPDGCGALCPPCACTEPAPGYPDWPTGVRELSLPVSTALPKGGAIDATLTFTVATYGEQQPGTCTTGASVAASIEACYELGAITTKSECLAFAIEAGGQCLYDTTCETPPVATCDRERSCCSGTLKGTKERSLGFGVTLPFLTVKNKAGKGFGIDCGGEVTGAYTVSLSANAAWGPSCGTCDAPEISAIPRFGLSATGEVSCETKLLGFFDHEISATVELCSNVGFQAAVGCSPRLDPVGGASVSVFVPQLSIGWLKVSPSVRRWSKGSGCTGATDL